MPLKTLVKASSITSLGDARYCAGMGVDFLGFRAIESSENHMPPQLFQEIRGWISGPAIVAEMYGMRGIQDIERVRTDYAPDYIEMSHAEFLAYGYDVRVPLIVNVSGVNGAIEHKPDKVAFWIVGESELAAIGETHPDLSVLVAPSSGESVPALLNNKRVKGLIVAGDTGDFEQLAAILESLEEE